MTHDTGRRRFLKHSLATAATLSVPVLGLLPGCRRKLERKPLERSGSPKSVLVIGAGLAGLSAAYELNQTGHQVTILEAQQHPGGRVLTFRAPLADGLYAEAGAARINASHYWTMEYIKLFGLHLEPFYPDAGKFIEFSDGARRQVPWTAFADSVQKYAGSHLDDSWHGFRIRGDRRWLKIKGGNDLLPAAFAGRLVDKIVYEAPLEKIEHDAHRVRAIFRQRGAYHSLEADRLLCTVPFSVLRNTIEVTPRFSDEKQKVIDELHYSMASRTCLQVRKRFWQENGENGFAITDRPAEVWQPSFNQTGVRGILELYLGHMESLKLMAYSESKRLGLIVKKMEHVFPGTQKHFELGVAKYWCQDLWSRGAWSVPREDQLKSIKMPEGRIHFAGEHTSEGWAWMQGALESGYRVAREINNAFYYDP